MYEVFKLVLSIALIGSWLAILAGCSYFFFNKLRSDETVEDCFLDTSGAQTSGNPETCVTSYSDKRAIAALDKQFRRIGRS